MCGIASCTSKSSGFCQVTGRVLYKGEPADGAQVIFHPKTEAGVNTRIPTGQVKEDGTFTLSTLEPGDGAPPGDYYVFVIWTEDRATPVKLNLKKRRVKSVPEDFFKGKYADHKNPKFFAMVVAGRNDLPPFQIND
jgi:hypothetical protein